MTRLMPWGKATAYPKTGKLRLRLGKRQGRGQSDPSLRSMNYPANDPAQWPVVPDPATGRRGNNTLQQSATAKANKHNSAINRAYNKLSEFPGGLK